MSKYFKTSDGQEFYQENDAKNHAKTLEDKTVTAPSDEAIAEMEVVVAKVETGEDSTDKGSDEGSDEGPDQGSDEGPDQGSDEGSDEAPKAEALKDEAPKAINLSKMTKAELVAFALDNELTVDQTATNAVIVESIEVQLTEKNQA